ncbi:DUF5057 domain-containing protein [Clostridium sp. AM58-1XD]|uniref:DUF5057 domain-containing protein n=1 Tax=Clostridium sp. AM58-1XD TaxID=2292307 RepID=UPI001FA8C697|nr:DUF5057 domain-containing protein [Clostridium sp. AM58-1XD]
MTADLAADYDVIYIGENVDLFGENTIYKQFPYNHMGDIVRTDTLSNGLRKEDYITKEGFQSLLGKNDIVNLSGDLHSNKDALWNENLKEQWKNGNSAMYFLRNMSLIPELENGNTLAGEARFSGNDLTDSMRVQLEEFIKADMPVIAAGKVIDTAWAVKNDLDNKGSKPQSPADANIYQVLAENLEKDNRQIFREPDFAETIDNLELPNNRPEVKIHFDENETIAPVQPEGDEERKTILELERSNSLSFTYEADSSAALTLIIDVNGDGMFTETKSDEDTSSSGSGQASQDQTKELPHDYVYKIPADEADGEISIDLSSLGLDDEVYQFQLTAVSGDMRSRDRGYFRPVQQKRDIKILQVIPEDGDQWNLQSNTKFMELLRDVTENEDSTEYGKIEFEAKTCENISDAGKGLNLDDYDMILFGMGFDSDELLNGETDITDPDAIEKLREYIEKEKRPVIFTNDSMSYVNSLNYMTPVEKKFVWKQMTVADYNRFTSNGTKKLTDDGVNFKKTEYEVGTPVGDNGISAIENLNSQMDKEGVSSDEHIYLSDEYQKNVQGYRKVIAPVKEGTADYQLGAEYRVIIWFSTKDYDIPLYNSSGSHGSATCAEVYDFFNGKGFSVEMQSVDRLLFPIKYYNLARGATTLEEFRAAMESSDTVKWGSWTKRTAYWKDVYSMFLSKGDVVPESRIDIMNPVTVAGQTYYLYDDQYLAYPADESTTITCRESWKYAVEETSASGGEVTGKRSFTLMPVAGNEKAMYPDKPAWNYYVTQSFRNTLGMDRFGITITEADRKKQDKDLGSVRYRNDNKNDGIWKDDEIKQLQGFTDGMLLEYASLASGLNDNRPFSSANKGYLYGAENRTSRAEELNPGIVSCYPYEINTDAMVEIKENHAPYYELSLNRQNRKEYGDITVWYTLGSTPGGPDGIPDEESEYFATTRKDASNNYYLYSKGNVFYTGFSIYGDSAEDSKDGRTEETKLFINTIFAALKTSNPRKDETVYTVVKEDSETGIVYISKEAGGSSRYVHYYDEDDNQASIYFCLEKQELSVKQLQSALEL